MTVIATSEASMPDGADELGDVLRRGRIHSVYQPIVDLRSGCVVAYEALARGPGGPMASPAVLFDLARGSGRLVELDMACRAAAISNAVAAGVREPLTLFVNVEPEALGQSHLDAFHEMAAPLADADGVVPVVLEITERALDARPADLLRTVQRARELGWRIALDDVGVERASLTFIPLLRPDILKLDMSLVQQRPSQVAGEVMHAANAYCEQSGAVLLAEGIETEAHLLMARGLGATLGQGWYFGRPAAEVDSTRPTQRLALSLHHQVDTPASPFQCLPANTELRRAPKRLLIELSKFLEGQAARAGQTSVLLSTFQEAKHFTAHTRHRYTSLARQTGFVAALGEGMEEEPAPGVRGSTLAEGDPVRGEWDVVITGPQLHVALLARDLGDSGPEADRMFEYALTYRRDTVTSALQSLMSRISPHLSGPAPAGAPAAGGSVEVVDGVVPAIAMTSSSARRADVPVPDAALTQRALAASSSGVVIVDMSDVEQRILYANEALQRLTGVPVGELVGQNCRVLQGPDTDPTTVERIRGAINSGRECREIILNYRRDGDALIAWWNEIHLSPVHDDLGRVVQYIGVQNDVSSKVAAEQMLAAEAGRAQAYLEDIQALAYSDSLTGLANRRQVENVVEQLVDRVQSTGNAVTLMYLDLDQFKVVNDALGHAAGDELLEIVGRRLTTTAPGVSVIGRMGGDEFVVVSTGSAATAEADAQRLHARIMSALATPVSLGGHTMTPAASVGWSISPRDGDTFGTLLHAADMKMYEVKHRHRLRVE